MTYKGFAGCFEYDEEAGVFHGEVVNIRDVITFQAKTAADIEKEFHASVDVYLNFCGKMEKAMPESSNGSSNPSTNTGMAATFRPDPEH